MILQTERLLIRQFTCDDLDALALILADEQVMRFSVSGPLRKMQVAELLQNRIIPHYDQFGFGLYAVVDRVDERLIGGVGLLSQLIENEERVELTYRLAPEYWGKGLATEAAGAICQYAIEQYHLNEIISIIDPQNIRSLEVAKRVGMQFCQEATFHSLPVHIYTLDRFQPYHFDKILYQLVGAAVCLC